MRSHRAADHWRRIYVRDYEIRIDRVTFADVLGIGSGSVSFTGGITAIVGANGVGKSTLLGAIHSSLTHRGGASLVGGNLKIKECVLEAALTVEAQSATRRTTFDSTGSPTGNDAPLVPVTLLNPGLEGARIIERCASISNIEELLEGYPSKNATSEELALASYVANKEYSSIVTYEIDDLFEPNLDDAAGEPSEREVEPFPYFVVSSGGATYRTETMGLGEMAIHMALWHLQRIPERSILLLEEPETFIAPRSQSALMDALAEASSERQIWTIVTTHSPVVLSHVPSDHIRLLVRSAQAIEFLEAPADRDLQVTLGIVPRKAGAFLVEDRFAREFVVAWLAQCGADLAAAFETKDVSLAGIQSALDKTPIFAEWFALVGLYDGDQRGRQSNRRWPHAYLVGDTAPELLFMNSAKQMVGCLAERLGRDEREVRVVLAALEGQDHHDWFQELVTTLGVRYERLIGDMLSCWLELDDNRAKSDAAIEALRKAVAIARNRPLDNTGT